MSYRVGMGGNEIHAVCGPGQDPEFDGCSLTGSAVPSSNNWVQFLQGLIQQGVDITRSVVTPPTVRRNADGSIQIRNQPGVTPSVAAAGVTSSVPGWVWVGGAFALVAILASSKRR